MLSGGIMCYFKGHGPWTIADRLNGRMIDAEVEETKDRETRAY
jgi:hypothetical protein